MTPSDTATIATPSPGRSPLPAHDVTGLGLATEGVRRIEWAEREMPVLRLIRERFARERPLDGLRIGACLHVTTETANLMRTLAAGGAEVYLAASNPLSTKDDVAAALVAEYGIATFARRGEDRDTYYAHLNQVADTRPQITMDDGCDLVSLLHSERPDQVRDVLAGTEETTTGVIRLMANSGHFDAELDLKALREMAEGHVRDARENVQEFDLGGKRVYLIAEGRLVNLGAAEGHPAAVMDMSFANQALSAEYVAQHHAELVPQVYVVPEAIDAEVARLKLAALGITLDAMTPEQLEYVSSWKHGT